MRNVVIGFLGTQLDMGKRRPWRPTLALATHDGFLVDRLELIHDRRHIGLANGVAADIRTASPETEVRLIEMNMKNPWDFQEVYGKLYDFAAQYGFDEDRERYHVHLTTGTHVAQICWFLLTESRHIPARLAQTGPPRGEGATGTLDIIDLDLARYNALQRRFEAAAREHSALLLGGVAGVSPAMQALAERLDLVATTSDAPILLLGEPGTGKSQLAARIHELKLMRRRIKGRLVQANCATLRGPGALAALFGQRRGAAGTDRSGLLREADGGVLFLDQIDALDPDVQAALLDALETGRYCPVGSDAEVTARFHLVAAASTDPGALLRAGALRPDLHARLSQWVFRLPPLRERRAEVEAQVLHLMEESERQLGRKTGFNADALARYLRFAHDPSTFWPGNLRDLQASCHRMAVLAAQGRVTSKMVEEEVETLTTQWAAAARDTDQGLLAEVLDEPATLDEFDRAQLASVIRACRESATLSAAGRRLFAASRQGKTSQNDADRLRKYLARFGLDWASVT